MTQSRITAQSRSTWLMLFAVRTYVIFLSPFFGGACKFYPSCSQYAQEAILRHGARHGFILALKRLGRCRPGTQGGFDPVPDREDLNESRTSTQGEELAQWTR